MQPVTQDITIYQGDRFDLFFRLRQKVWNPALNNGVGAYEPGPYINLTGKTIRAQIRNNVSDETIRATFTPTLSDQVATPGGCTLTLLPAETTVLAAGGVYDVELETTANPVDRQTIIRGAVTLVLEVTRV